MRALLAQERIDAHVPGFGSVTIPVKVPFWILNIRFPDSGKIYRREHRQPHAAWKVIAMINGEIEAVPGPAAHDRSGSHEWTVWEGQAADKAEALQRAEQADPRVDFEWMRIRYERDLIIR